MFAPSSLHTQNINHKPSSLPIFSIQEVIRDVQINFSVNTYEYNIVKSKNTSSTRVKHSHVTTKINAILEIHSFDDQCNVIKSIIQHNSSSIHLKFLGKSSS